nr:G protein regulated inducer of neurite outgrowth [Hymenolepis microstoma]
MDPAVKSIGSSPIPSSKILLKRRSISIYTGVPLNQAEIDRLKQCLQVRRNISNGDDGVFAERLNKTSSSGNVSTIVKSKLRSFGRQIHRHMIETFNVTNDISHGIPRSAMGDIYFSSYSPSSLTPRRKVSNRYRRAKLSLDLEDTRKHLEVFQFYDVLNKSAQSCSSSKLKETAPLATFYPDSGSAKHRIIGERRLSVSAPHLKYIGKFNEPEANKNRSNTSPAEEGSSNSKSIRPREVSYDEQGQTWEIYGADQDPSALGQAIENHLEKMMQRTQREQRCFSLVNEYPRQNTSTKSSSRGSHTKEQIIQAARRRFRRRAISSANSNSPNTNTEEMSPERENQGGRRSCILSYISRILRRSSTSALPARRRNLQHQDSIVECGEQNSSVEKLMVSAT